MSAGITLRKYLLSDTTGVAAIVGTGAYQGSVPTTAALPFVWLRRRSVEYLEILNEAEDTPYIERYDIECVAETLDSVDSLADAVRTRLQGKSGALGSTLGDVYQWVSVSDQREDYIPRHVSADELLQVVSLDLEVINQ